MSSGAALPDLWPGAPKEMAPCALNSASASTIGALVWSVSMRFFLKDRRSDPLEVAGHFPVGDAAVGFRLLPLRRVHVVVDHLVAEGLAQHRRAVQRRSGLAQGGRDLWPALGEIGI